MVAHRLGISHTQVVAHGFVLALGGVAPLAHHLLDLHDVGPLLLRDHRINLSEDGDANCAQERHTGTRENDSQASQAYFSEPAALSSSLSCALPPQPFRGSLSSLHWPAAGRRMCGDAHLRTPSGRPWAADRPRPAARRRARARKQSSCCLFQSDAGGSSACSGGQAPRQHSERAMKASAGDAVEFLLFFASTAGSSRLPATRLSHEKRTQSGLLAL